MRTTTTLTAAVLVVLGAGWFGCERTPPAPPVSTAPVTQPTADELASARDLIKESGTSRMPEGMGALPQGHPPVSGMGTPGSGMGQPAGPEPTDVGEVTYAAPPEWKHEGGRGLRIDQFRLPRVTGDGEDGELAVFGPDIGGGVQANLDRWRAQITLPDGQPVPAEGAVQEKLEVEGLTITVLDVAGRYSAGTMSMGGGAQPKDDYRLLGAIVETPKGPWYFKAVGPAATMGAHRDVFMEFLRTMRYAPPRAGAHAEPNAAPAMEP